MIIVFTVTSFLIMITMIVKGVKSVEMALIAPFFFGSITLPLIGVPFFNVSYASTVLVFFIFFEWILLFILGFFLVPRQSFKTWKASNIEVKFLIPGIKVFTFFVIVVLIYYLLNELYSLAMSSDINQYLLEKRSLAHKGLGIDHTNPFVYRAINFSMALMIVYVVIRYSSPGAGGKNQKYYMFFLFIVGGMASLLEGNRSTLIVTLVSIFVYLFISGNIRLRGVIYASLSFILVFSVLQQVLRLDGDFTFNGILIGLQWFVLYAFGSVASFSEFFVNGIDIYWKSYDIVAQKLGFYIFPVKEFFFIDSVPVGEFKTNVYGGYAVLYDYLGYFIFIFILIKISVYYFLTYFSAQSLVARSVTVALTASFPLTIYHEYFVTALYYAFNISLVLLFSLVIAFILRALPRIKNGL